MKRLENWTQNYTQAPGRKQLQWAAVFSLCLIFIALVASVYLNVSARAAQVGRKIQVMQAEIERLDREIEDKQSRLAMILSSEEMEARARNLGFQPFDQEEVIYLKVPGYAGRPPAVLAPYTQRSLPGAPLVPLQYTESLTEWFQRKAGDFVTALISPSNPSATSGVKP